MNHDALLCGHAFVDRWEEQLAVISKLERWLVAVSNQADLLHIRRVVIEHQLHHEVVVSRRLRIELEAYEAEGLALDEAGGRVSLVSARGILLDLVVSRRVARVEELNGLVDRFVWPTRRED